MKRMGIVFVALAYCVSTAFAADMVMLKTKAGTVTFNHKVHGEKVGCKACHPEATPAKITLGGKEPAHKLCSGCHKEKKAGPTKCMDCHKKK